MLKLAFLNKAGSSTGQIDIEDIKSGILKLPGNNYRLVLSTGSVNFELKSEDEQDALIDTFESFLNSIGFAIQFLIRTREIDMDDYLDTLKNKIAAEEVDVYKEQLESYRQFVSSLIASNQILSRQFYVIIPFDSPKALEFNMIRDQLNLRADIVAKNLARLGISTKELSSIELIDLFYSFYSPEHSKVQPISEKALMVMNSEFIVKDSNEV